MKTMMKSFAIAALAALAAGPAFAVSARDAMQLADDVANPKYSMSQVQMDLIDKNGSVQSRQMLEYGMEDDQKLKSEVIIFQSPASVKDTRFLQKDKEGGGSDKWIYMPSLRSTRRIAASEGQKAFMGSDASYDDLSTREVDDYEHEMVEENATKTIGDATYTCWNVKSTPKPTTDSEYGYILSWVDQNTHKIPYAEMYDKDGKLLKVLTVEKLGQVGDYWIALTDLLENVQTGHSTRLTIKQMRVDPQLTVPARVFTTNFLNTGK